jgi:double-stranded uracil-DNA glycosylase
MKLPPGPCTPTAGEIRAAMGCRIPDVIAPRLKVLFCGVNPGLYSAATKRHFARPGNRFWPALHLAGFTTRLLTPYESHELLGSGYGITSLVRRATATVREVAPPELVAGRRRLVRMVRSYRPRWVAVFGVGAYRTAFAHLNAQVGQQDALGDSSVWLLPSPSGANGSYPLVDLTRELRAFYNAVNQSERDSGVTATS